MDPQWQQKIEQDIKEAQDTALPEDDEDYSWERGQPDYEGAASFDNILKKVDIKHKFSGIFLLNFAQPSQINETMSK